MLFVTVVLAPAALKVAITPVQVPAEVEVSLAVGVTLPPNRSLRVWAFVVKGAKR